MMLPFTQGLITMRHHVRLRTAHGKLSKPLEQLSMMKVKFGLKMKTDRAKATNGEKKEDHAMKQMYEDRILCL